MPVRIVGLLLALLALSACVSTPPRIDLRSADEIWQARQKRLHLLENWELKGRIGFVSEHDSGSASLYWKQNRTAYELQIVAPLGMGSLVVVGDANGVVLQSSEGEILYGEDVQQLLWQKTGWLFPMDNLRYWILGLSLDNEAINLDDFGRLQQIQNESWQVEYQSYQPVDQYELPRKLTIKSSGVQIKLIVKDWQIL
ncbi:MAG: outer membrane lipoprotein LolB [Gammaproteobacteria bacterium]|nr:outer membrane lipoprotein LolB [Gammaproteobacteria bacterium]